MWTVNKRVILIEPFYGGSHKQLMSCLEQFLASLRIEYELYTLPAKKWHWRARTSALYFSQKIPKDQEYHILFCSSVLNLAEFVALRPEFMNIKKLIYFHENQFVYPTRGEKERDFQYGYNTILSALIADNVIFNSNYNQNSFLDNIQKHLKKQPDYPVNGLREEILPKCRVIYFPVDVPKNIERIGTEKLLLHIIWPHRWEHDKNPLLLFETLYKLQENGVKFRISVLGESFEDVPPMFEEAKKRLADSIENFGRIENRIEYLRCLSSGDVVLSTATHEFFGVAMMEAVMCGCYPLAPSNLVYPEIYPEECLYRTSGQLFKKLRDFCLKPYLVGKKLENLSMNFEQFSVKSFQEKLKGLN